MLHKIFLVIFITAFTHGCDRSRTDSREEERVKKICDYACKGLEWRKDCRWEHGAIRHCACTCSNGSQTPFI